MNLQRQAQESERGRLDLTAALYKDNASLVGEFRKAATVRARNGLRMSRNVERQILKISYTFIATSFPFFFPQSGADISLLFSRLRVPKER
jgi:hypothetical protein